jgi:hypothetical protein
MTRWVMWLLAWLAVIGLPWSLGLHAGDISQVLSPVSLSSHTVLRTIGVIRSTRPPSIHTREARDLSALPRACLLAGADRPPWLDTRGRPAPGRTLGAWDGGRPGRQLTGEAARVFPKKIHGLGGPDQENRVLQQPLARPDA